MNSGPILEAVNPTEADRGKNLLERLRRERLLVCQIAVTYPHSVDALRIGNVNDTQTAGSQNAVNPVKDVKQFVPSEMFQQVKQECNVN
jgi:hypothetical protein